MQVICLNLFCETKLHFIIFKSLEPLVQTIAGLCDNKLTTVLCCYEQRTTGNKPELEKKFFEVSDSLVD
jgi:hypothetical protein